MYPKNIVEAISTSAVHRANAESLIFRWIVSVIKLSLLD